MPAFLAPVLAIAHNDLRLLFRDRMNCFFTFIFPVIFALLFGFIFGGGGGSSAAMSVAVVDLDQSPQSRLLISTLTNDSSLKVKELASQTEGEALVRTGKTAACIVVPRTFGDSAKAIFSGEPMKLSTLVDPARRAEAGLLSGKLYQAAFGVLGQTVTDPVQLDTALTQAEKALATSSDLSLPERAAYALFFGTVKSSVQRLRSETISSASTNSAATGTASTGTANPATANTATPTNALATWQPLDITITQLAAEAAARSTNPRSSFQVSYGQGVVWGLMGCVVAFIGGLSTERAHGTLSRLLIAPIRPAHVLLAKALACFLACMLVQGLLLLAVFTASALAEGGRFRVLSFPMLFVTACASSLALTALMMALGTMVKSEAGGSGMGRAVLLVLAIVGGGTIPVFLMPSWMQSASAISPFHWSVLAIDGAVWRGFHAAEYMLPLGILAAITIAGAITGTLLMRRVRAA